MSLTAKILPAIAPGENPFSYDKVRCGVDLAGGWVAMFSNVSDTEAVILVHTPSGQRMEVRLEMPNYPQGTEVKIKDNHPYLAGKTATVFCTDQNMAHTTYRVNCDGEVHSLLHHEFDVLSIPGHIKVAGMSITDTQLENLKAAIEQARKNWPLGSGKVAAIKALREMNGSGLREAKDAIEMLAERKLLTL